MFYRFNSFSNNFFSFMVSTKNYWVDTCRLCVPLHDVTTGDS